MSKVKKSSDEPNVEELSNEELDDLQGGGDDRSTLDHIGNFNFKVEIDGVSSAELKPRTSATHIRALKRK